jgi:hypothetical protein
MVWNQVKQRVAKQPVRSTAQRKAKALAALRSLQRLPERIRSFFRDPGCAYAWLVDEAMALLA